MMTNAETAQNDLPVIDRLWNYADPSGTEVKFRELHSQTEKTAPLSYVAELLTQIARCQGLQGKFDAAHQTLNDMEIMLVPEMDRVRLRYLLERGRVINSSGTPTKALPLFQQAWELGQASGETRLAFDALHMIALVQPDNASKVEWNLKGIAAIEQIPSARGWLPAFYNNLGEAYAAQQDYQKALEAFRRLSEITTANGKLPDIHTEKDIARMLRKLNRVDEACAVIRPIHEGLEAKNEPDGWIDEEMAECLLSAGDTAKAQQLFRRAYDALRNDTWVRQNDPGKLDRLKTMAGF